MQFNKQSIFSLEKKCLGTSRFTGFAKIIDCLFLKKFIFSYSHFYFGNLFALLYVISYIGQYIEAAVGKTWTNGQKMDKPFWPFIPLRFKVLAPPYGLASNSPQTHRLPWWQKPSLWLQWRHKSMAKCFWPLHPVCAAVSTASHDSASISPQTQLGATVIQAVAMATMTS